MIVIILSTRQNFTLFSIGVFILGVIVGGKIVKNIVKDTNKII